jgi:hypothetical protein
VDVGGDILEQSEVLKIPAAGPHELVDDSKSLLQRQGTDAKFGEGLIHHNELIL